MPGFNPQNVANKVQTGNSVLLQIGQQVVFFAQTVGHSIPMGGEHFFGIGSSKPQEIQQLRMSPQVTLDSFELTENGQTLLQGGVNFDYLLAGNQFNITVLDGATGNPLFIYVGAKCGTFSSSIPTNAPIRSNYTFLALDVIDMDGNSLMDTGDNALEISGNVAGSPPSGLGVGFNANVSVNASVGV